MDLSSNDTHPFIFCIAQAAVETYYFTASTLIFVAQYRTHSLTLIIYRCCRALLAAFPATNILQSPVSSDYEFIQKKPLQTKVLRDHTRRCMNNPSLKKGSNIAIFRSS